MTALPRRARHRHRRRPARFARVRGRAGELFIAAHLLGLLVLSVLVLAPQK